MPKKTSVKLAAESFMDDATQVLAFFTETAVLKEAHAIWCADYSILRLYLEFETLMLKTLIGAINNDTDTLSQSSGFSFPKHLSQDVCTYLVIGNGYFDFKGRDGLIKTIKRFVPKGHYLLDVVRDHKYKDDLEQLIALRNFAAHRSRQAKKKAADATGVKKMGSSGAWLRVHNRFQLIVEHLKELAKKIRDKAPY